MKNLISKGGSMKNQFMVGVGQFADLRVSLLKKRGWCF